MSSKRGNREEGQPSNVSLEDQKSPLIHVSGRLWRAKIVNSKPFSPNISSTSFLLPKPWKMSANVSSKSCSPDQFPPVGLILNSQQLQLLLSCNQSGGRRVYCPLLYSEKVCYSWAKRKNSPLWDFASFIAQTRCIHKKVHCLSESQPNPLATIEFIFLRVWVISITSEFPPVLGSKEKSAPTGLFSSLGISTKNSLHGRDDCLFLFNCDWWPRNHSHQMQRLC